MSQYSSPEAVLVPGPVTLVGPPEAAVDDFLAVVLFFAVSLWASTIVAARTIITSKNQILSIYVLQFSGIPVVVQLGKEVSQTRDYCVARNATLRAARPDPSLRKERLLRMTIKLDHYLFPSRVGDCRRTVASVQRLAGSEAGFAIHCVANDRGLVAAKGARSYSGLGRNCSHFES